MVCEGTHLGLEEATAEAEEPRVARHLEGRLGAAQVGPVEARHPPPHRARLAHRVHVHGLAAPAPHEVHAAARAREAVAQHEARVDARTRVAPIGAAERAPGCRSSSRRRLRPRQGRQAQSELAVLRRVHHRAMHALEGGEVPRVLPSRRHHLVDVGLVRRVLPLERRAIERRALDLALCGAVQTQPRERRCGGQPHAQLHDAAELLALEVHLQPGGLLVQVPLCWRRSQRLGHRRRRHPKILLVATN